jgi:hypothetical protein
MAFPLLLVVTHWRPPVAGLEGAGWQWWSTTHYATGPDPV